MIGPDDRRHGALAGYVAGCRDECCRNAAWYYEKRRRYDHETRRPRQISAAGTVRRLQALIAIGWPTRDIAARMGVNGKVIQRLISQDAVLRTTAARVSALYDELCMTPGPSGISRSRAKTRGWFPPLAWDDETIDDPNAKPWTEPKWLKRDLPIDEVAVQRALTGDRTVRLTKQERLEVVRRWQAAGKSIEELNRIHGWNAQRDLREIRSAA